MEDGSAASAKPILNHRREFEEILNDYKISDTALATLRKTPLVLMVAATASGRNTIINYLVQTGNYYNVVSDTTRPKRIKDGVEVEHDGVEYFFRAEEDVLQDLREGKFVEAALIHGQQVSGVSIREIEKARVSGKVPITDVEVQGCKTIAQLKPDLVPIFVLAPSFEEWLRRIRKRSNLTSEEIKTRLETAVQEYEIALKTEHFIFVVNDELDHAVKVVDQIARLNQHDRALENEARALAMRLRDEAISYLKSYPNW
jgi:guanylate kinase